MVSGESMVYKCGNEITPHIPVIVRLCLEYLCYDPNYNYDDDDAGEDNGNDMARTTHVQLLLHFSHFTLSSLNSLREDLTP